MLKLNVIDDHTSQYFDKSQSLVKGSIDETNSSKGQRYFPPQWGCVIGSSLNNRPTLKSWEHLNTTQQTVFFNLCSIRIANFAIFS